MDINYHEVGYRIRLARRKLRMTQEYASELVGISPSHLGHIENGKTKVGLQTIVSLSDVLDVSLDELLCGSMHRGREIIQSEVSSLLDACTPTDVPIVMATLRALTHSLHESRNTDTE